MYSPAARPVLATILLVPGSGPLDVDGNIGGMPFLWQLARAFQTRGLATLRLGKYPLSIADDEYYWPPRSYHEEYFEPYAAFHAAIVARQIPLDYLFLLGHSLGGHVLSTVAARIENVRGLVMINSNWRPLAEIRKIQGRVARQTSKSRLSAYLRHSYNFDPTADLRSTKFPILCIRGERDLQVPREDYDQWIKLMQRRPAQFDCAVYESLDHFCIRRDSDDPTPDLLLDHSVSEELIDDITAWVRRVRANEIDMSC